MTDRVQFRIDNRLAEFLAQRRSHEKEPMGQTVRRLLNFYRALLERGRREIAQAGFSPREARLIVDACNGWLPTPEFAHLIWAEVDEAIKHDGLDEKWGVDGAALVEKMRSLSPAGLFALTDLVMCYFGGEHAGTDVEVDERLRAIGFPVAAAQGMEG